MKFQIGAIDLTIEQEIAHHIRFLYSIAESGIDVKITKFREEIRTEIRTRLSDLKTDLTWRMVLLVSIASGVTSAIIKIM